MLNILLTLLLFTTGLVSAQTQTNIVYPTRASSGASTLQTGFGYKYMGCYNETNTIAGSGGARALSQSGTNTATNIMDVGTCLNFCGGSKFAGLEYGELRDFFDGKDTSTNRIMSRPRMLLLPLPLQPERATQRLPLRLPVQRQRHADLRRRRGH
jgi:hypothetical protein